MSRSASHETPASIYPLTLLYDGNCPICKLEMDNLQARDAHGRLLLVDIAAAGFDIAPYARAHGVSHADLMALIHAVRADARLVVGVEVFRLAYGAVGLGALTRPTGWPLLAPVFDRAYAIFARHRYAMSAVIAPLIERVAAARALKRSQACKDSRGGQACAIGHTNQGRSTS